MSPWPFFGIELTICEVRSAGVSVNPGLSVGGIVKVGPLIKGFEVVNIPEGC